MIPHRQDLWQDFLMAHWPKEKALDIAIAAIEGEPWERQLGWKESPQAYAAFQMFRDLDAGQRTLTLASKMYAEKYDRSPNSTRGLIGKWSAVYRWTERSTAYDNMLDAKDISERKRQLVKRTRKHAEVMEKAQEALIEPLRVYQDRLKEMANGIRSNDLEAVDPETGLDKFSDVELIELGRAALKVVMDSQRAEREALGATSGESAAASGKVAAMRGQVLRRILADKDARTTLEHVQFEIAEAERSESANG